MSSDASTTKAKKPKMGLLAELRSLPSASKRYLINQHISAYYFTWPIFVLFMNSQYGLKAAAAYLSATALAQLVFELPTGIFADIFGQAKSILLGSIIGLISTLLLAFGNGALLPVLCGILLGLGSAFISGAADALFYHNVSHQDYETAMHHEVAAYQSGLILSAALGGVLYKVSPTLPFVAQALVFVLAAIPLLGLHDAKAGKELAKQLGRAKSGVHVLVKTFGQIASNAATVRLFFGAALLATIMNLFIDLLLETRMIELQITPELRGMAIAVCKLATIVTSQILLQRYLRSIRAKLMVSLGVCAVVMPLMSLGGALWFVLMYYLMSFATIYRDAALMPMVQKSVTGAYRATAISMYAMLGRVQFALFTLGVGAYLAHNKVGMVLVACGVLAVVVCAPLLLAAMQRYNAVSEESA